MENLCFFVKIFRVSVFFYCRYIEVFRSSQDEVRNILQRLQGGGGGGGPSYGGGPMMRGRGGGSGAGGGGGFGYGYGGDGPFEGKI